MPTMTNCADEQSEMIIGEWMEKRQIRSELVIARHDYPVVLCPADTVTQQIHGVWEESA